MWLDCPKVMDENARFFRIEMDDFYVILGAAALAAPWLEAWQDLCLMVGLTMGVHWLKRGKPPGYLLHQVHRYCFPYLRLPGILAPQSQRYSPWS